MTWHQQIILLMIKIFRFCIMTVSASAYSMDEFFAPENYEQFHFQNTT